MKTLVLFLTLCLTATNLFGQKIVNQQTLLNSSQLQTKKREIEQHYRMLQNAVKEVQSRLATDLSGIHPKTNEGNQHSNSAMLLMPKRKHFSDSLQLASPLDIDSTFYHVDSTLLDKMTINTIAEKTSPWFKPYIRKRLPHGVD